MRETTRFDRGSKMSGVGGGQVVLWMRETMRVCRSSKMSGGGEAGGTMDARNDAAREVDVRAGHAAQGGCRIQVVK